MFFQCCSNIATWMCPQSQLAVSCHILLLLLLLLLLQPSLQWVSSVFPGGNAAGAWIWPSTPFSAEVKERVELYLYSPSGPSRPFIGLTVLLLVRLQEAKYHSVRSSQTAVGTTDVWTTRETSWVVLSALSQVEISAWYNRPPNPPFWIPSDFKKLKIQAGYWAFVGQQHGSTAKRPV